LKRVVADKTLDVIFSKVPCKKSRLYARAEATLARRISEQLREVMPVQGSLSIERMCRLAEVRSDCRGKRRWSAVGDSAQSPSGTGGAKTGLALLAIWLDDDRQAA
jgi:hypothetical protein